MEVIYLCDDFIVISKPYGMLSERPANGADRENCPDAIAEYLESQGKKAEIFTVHRLDATTAGVMVYALTKKAAADLSRQITEGTFTKTYRAWISADEALPESGEMRDRLFFDRRADKSFVVKGDKKGAKEAILTYQLGEAFMWEDNRVTPVDISLLTGRTHQIRVQFASRKSPLVGDGKYGSRIKRHDASLWSVSLSFVWKNKTVRFELDPPVPEQV